MTERHLSDLLETLGDRVEVSPPRTAAMLRAASHARRRRTAWTIAGAAAAAALVAAGTQIVSDRLPGSNDPTRPAPTADAVPDGMRLVAIGRAAIAVPKGWSTGKMHCGTPLEDTVVIDPGAIRNCLVPRPAGVDSVWVYESVPTRNYRADETYEIDGVRAERQQTSCGRGNDESVMCTGVVGLPSLGVYFEASSSTSRATVDEILENVRILDDRAGVPGYLAVTSSRQEDSFDAYADRLRSVGLSLSKVEVTKPGMSAGFVLEVSPAPGSLLRPGEKVTVTVSAPPRGPAEELNVGMATEPLVGEPADLTDEQIRAGATIRLRVGGLIWAYAFGKRERSLAGELDGSSLVVDDWVEGPNYPHAWQAVAPGTTKVTLTISADGQRIELGTVTVVVDP